ncbi:MAG: hypothetical protein JRG95_21910 [Deltaproteobacteria bacterium]|nr:hypothetical protein [Deltaproteobacteria bacterium]
MNRIRCAVWFGAISWAAAAATAQPMPGGVSSLAVAWSRGEYRAPMICEIEGRPARALRRVVVQPGPPRGKRLTGKLVLFDLEAPPGTRCYGETGDDQPNLVGTLRFLLDGRTGSDTANHDFDEILRRKGGFQFDVISGSLRVGPAGVSGDELEPVTLGGSELWMEHVKRGSDEFRRLAEFPGRIKRVLVLTLADGRSWKFELVEWAAPRPRNRP